MISFLPKKMINVNSCIYSIISLSNGNIVGGLTDGFIKVWDNELNEIRSFKNANKSYL